MLLTLGLQERKTPEGKLAVFFLRLWTVLAFDTVPSPPSECAAIPVISMLLGSSIFTIVFRDEAESHHTYI